MWKKTAFLVFFIGFSTAAFAQDITLFSQFNGKYDYTAIGNTMNLGENGTGVPCVINTSSQANLSLEENQNIVAAYLYWAGSGPGDFQVKLNDQSITAERTFSAFTPNGLEDFAAFTDVTEQVTNTGNGTYELSELDVTDVIAPYCPTGSNFAGWAIVVIYEDENLPLNQVNVYDGMQNIPNTVNIQLDNLNVLDTQGAKIGFIAWEGDSSISVSESLKINGNIVQNPPLNPYYNAFNGTNSFTGQDDLYNMDIDVYNIQNNIEIGDTSAEIELTSGQDFVMVNNIITVLNSQVPDASVAIDDVQTSCNDRTIWLEFSVFNNNSTEILPAGTNVAFFANNNQVGNTLTTEDIGIDESWNSSISLTIPGTQENIDIEAIIDPENEIPEINEENNNANFSFIFESVDEIPELPFLESCNEGNRTGFFDLTQQNPLIPTDNELNISYYESLEDAESDFHEIINPANYQSQTTPQTIYVRYEEEGCFDVGNFILQTTNCPPFVPEGFSPNGDGINDTFEISGLYDIFEQFELIIYNRFGNKIFEANNNTPEWDGTSNTGINSNGEVPTGTYYYVLKLNDPDYDIITGWVYLNR